MLAVTLLLWAGVACGQTWTQTSAPTNNWRGIALSADGMRIIALNCIEGQGGPLASNNPVYISTDSGVDWGPASAAQWYEWDGYLGYDGGFADAWEFLTCSADGKKLVVTSEAASSPLWFSRNFATTWFYGGPTTTWGTSQTCVGGLVTCSSADGNKIFAEAGAFYASFDSGTTWTNPPSPAELDCIATSADGTKLVAGTIYYDGLYLSTNSGLSWSATAPQNLQWGAVASSADGSKKVAAVYASSVLYSNSTWFNIGGPIYVSADSGATWAPTTAPMANWQSVA